MTLVLSRTGCQVLETERRERELAGPRRSKQVVLNAGDKGNAGYRQIVVGVDGEGKLPRLRDQPHDPHRLQRRLIAPTGL